MQISMTNVQTSSLINVSYINFNLSELKISDNSILGSPQGMNGKLRKQFQLEGPEKCADEFTIVFPREIDENSELENGAHLQDYKGILKIECSSKGSTVNYL